MARIIAVVAGKGGTGKTTTSINLAAALSDLGGDVLLLDADLQTPSVLVHLGEPEIPVTITEVIKGADKLKSAVYKTTMGFKLLPASLGFVEFGRELSKLKNAMKQARKLADYIIVDCPPGLGKIIQIVLGECDEVLVVTNPELPALADGIKSVQLAEKYDTTILGVVVNKATNQSYESLPSEVEALLNYPIISALPNEKSVKMALKYNKAVIQQAPRSKYSKGIRKLAAMVARKPYKEENGLFGRFFKRW